MMKLCILLAVAAAHRVSEVDVLAVEVEVEANNSKAKPGVTVLLVPGHEFAAMERPVISHQLEIKPGTEMVMDIQETGSGNLRAKGYEFSIAGPSGTLKVGKLSSKVPGLMSTRTKYEFKSAGKPLLRMYIPMVSAGGKTVHVTNDVRKNPHTYYTFSKDGAAINNGGGYTPGQVVFSVYKGRNMGFDEPYLQAKGHYQAWKFQFFLTGRAEPVALMAMTDNKLNKFTGTTKQRYRIKMQSGVDPLMLSMLVGFIDSCNNGFGGGGGYGGGGYGHGGGGQHHR